MKRINITCPVCGSKAYLRPASVVYGDKAPDPDAKYYVCGRYDDTHFTAKIEVNPSGTFYGWIFKFKGKIKILSPKECITEMQQIAQEFI